MNHQADFHLIFQRIADVLRPPGASPVALDRLLDFAAGPLGQLDEALAFWRVLEASDAAGLWPKQPIDRLLDMACGPCREAMWLGAWLRHRAIGDEGFRLAFHGVDVRAAELDRAAARLRESIRYFNDGKVREDTRLGFRFRCASGADLAGLGLAENYPVVFIRHQNAWNGERVWGRVFEASLERLAPGGRLIWTSYFDREHRLACQMIEAAGARLVGEWRNPHSSPLPTPGKSMDRWVAAAEVDGDRASPDGWPAIS